MNATMESWILKDEELGGCDVVSLVLYVFFFILVVDL